MINYFTEAEKTLRARGVLEQALVNLERRERRIIEHNQPTGYPSPDFSKPYAGTGTANDALSECLELAEVVREIAQTKATISEIDKILGQLEREEREILRLWYIERKSKEDIAAEIQYSSISSLYDLRNRAVADFALLYFGAGATGSI